MKVKIKEIELESSALYVPDSYPSGGIFLAKEKGKAFLGSDFIFVNKKECMCIHICPGSELQVEKEKEEKGGEVSQDLFLKALSLVVNKDESYR